MQILSNANSREAKKLRGVFTALVTPFLPDGALDLRNYERLIDAQLEGGIHGVVPCGTTGESPTLSSDEKRTLISLAVKKCKGRVLVIAGTGSNDTQRTIQDSKRACELGADALLVVTPYYNKPSQAGLEEHFRAVADESSIPVILYNVPGRTGVSLVPATVARLATHPRITAIKEASGNIALFTEMRAVVRAQGSDAFSFLSGDDVTTWPFLACGGDGVISVASNVLPRCMRMIFEDWNEGRVGMGLALHEKLSRLFNVLFVEANPVPVKTLLGWRGAMNPKVRLPLAPLQPENAQKLKDVWQSLLAHLRQDLPREDIHG